MNEIVKNRSAIDEGKTLMQYMADIFPAFVLLAVAALMTHGSILFSQRIGIDTEYIISGNHNFDLLGRQGLIWLADILEIDWFNPYLVQVLTVVFMVLAPVFFGFLFYRYSEQKSLLNVTLIVMGVSYIVSPFWAAQLYFLNQSAQVTFSCVLTAVAILAAEEGRKALRTKWYWVLFSVILMQFIFSSYQILIMIYVAGVTMVFLRSALNEGGTVKRQAHWILFHSGVFLWD